MQGYSKMVLPLTELTKGKSMGEWTEACQAAFDKVKWALTHAPLLRMPDYSKPFELVSDASVGALVNAHLTFSKAV